MRIYSMTATFGKLEHETLALEPGLNVISAGNEWGKSTWCAFLSTMLYGMDTRAKSTRTALADKERYAPWSGSPMSGRIDLNWNGRDITIERKTKGRTPMGDFRAYETDTGMEVPELDARNCGEMLLGVERSVFLRTGFIRFSDLNVTDDEALRRRLNSLVTTGDENSAADRLAGELKTLKNRIRHNRTGLLPQAEAERDRLETRCQEYKALEARNDEILRKLDSNEDWRMALENHRDALAYAASLEDARKVNRAAEAWKAAQAHYEELDTFCQSLPNKQTVQARLEEIHQLQDNLLDLQTRLQMIPSEKEPENLPAQFEGFAPGEARDKVREDVQRCTTLRTARNRWIVFGLLLGISGFVVMGFELLPGLVCALLGVAAVVIGLIQKMKRNRELKDLVDFYRSPDTDHWQLLAEEYEKGLEKRELENQAIRNEREAIQRKLEEVRDTIHRNTREDGLALSRGDWEGKLATLEAREDAYQAMMRAKEFHNNLKLMARQAKAPEFQDRMEYTEAYTARLLDECAAERTRLENQQGQCRGSMEAIGSKAEMERELEKVHDRIRGLEQTFSALTIAQETLVQATAQLQRRFAPRIARRAGELMSAMTEGRYDRLSIGEDLSLRAGARQENTLHEALWRSDGTVDQLYLSLRLAVAAELLPNGPLVLDDALVRFDDVRLKAAMEILRSEAQSRQVILFTCHNRERHL